MKETVTIKELLAIVIRRAKTMIYFILFFALLIGGIQACKKIPYLDKDNTANEKMEEDYLKAMADYQREKNNLETLLSKANYQVEGQTEYNKNSILLKIDPYNVTTTIIHFAITHADIQEPSQIFIPEDSSPLDFVTFKIQNQYLTYWDSLNLQTALRQYCDVDIADKYLREIMTLSPMDGGGLTLKVIGTKEQETKRLAEAAYALLLANQANIAKSSYPHNFALINNGTKITVDQELEENQLAFWEKIQTQEEQIDDLTKQLAQLTPPAHTSGYSVMGVIKSILKYLILGAVLGCVLGIAWILLTYIFRSRIETSHQLEQTLGLSFLGTTVSSKGLWNNLANRILNERTWPDEKKACTYAVESIKTHMPQPGTIALISTVLTEKERLSLEHTLQKISTQEVPLILAGDIRHDAKALETLQTCDYAILAERCGISRWDAVKATFSLAQDLNKTMIGFITI